ncbi:hypothetical protein EDB84DRAFT_1438686 [Lactarius hengduanensis]|nr:hypothetical protein EDB84DRAFT_1438686 [Lactarius hengduanensis]
MANAARESLLSEEIRSDKSWEEEGKEVGGKEGGPVDISEVPEDMEVDAEEKMGQGEVLTEILANRLEDWGEEDPFNDKRAHKLKLSALQRQHLMEENERKQKALRLLTVRNEIEIDADMTMPVGKGQVIMTTERTMLDYELTVGSKVGLGAVLPNARMAKHFMLELDLQQPLREFRGKRGMVGFDTKGKMLYIGRARNEDVFVAMAPNEFIRCEEEPCGAGHKTGRPQLSRRHYRQVVMMFAYFMAKIPELSFVTPDGRSVYELDLESARVKWDEVTNVLDHGTIKLNQRNTEKLDELMSKGYKDWVKKAPSLWKKDGFLEKHSPIVVTSRYGQNVEIAEGGSEMREASHWNKERDYSKVAFTTVALATLIECTEATSWEAFDRKVLKREFGALYDGDNKNSRKKVNLATLPMTTEEGIEIPIYDETGRKIPRRRARRQPEDPACGVLMDLTNVHSLFHPEREYPLSEEDRMEEYDELRPETGRVDVYPLGFLRTVGNVQAEGIPPCFYSGIREISSKVRADPNGGDEGSSSSSSSTSTTSNGSMTRTPRTQVIKPISSQFYNYISHRAASRAGDMDTEKGTVTAALAGAFATTAKDRATARGKQDQCRVALPWKRFHNKISCYDCPVSCRGEIVYAVNVRALKVRTGRSLFSDVIWPLVNLWRRKEVRGTIKDHVVIFKPEVRDEKAETIFPSLFEWVSYPVTTLIETIYEQELGKIQEDTEDEEPNQLKLELLAALERTLCYCHTGNAACLATTLMRPLGLSRGLIKDGFPMLKNVFKEKNILEAMKRGLQHRGRHKKSHIPFSISIITVPAFVHHGQTRERYVSPRLSMVDKRGERYVSPRLSMVDKRGERYVRPRLSMVDKRGDDMCARVCPWWTTRERYAYHAKLRLRHTLIVNPSISYNSSFSSVENRAMHVSVIAFQALFDDVKKLVADGVRRDIAAIVSAALTQDAVDVAVARGRERESSLKHWLSIKNPLAYGKVDKQDTFVSLLQAVVADPHLISHGLPNFSGHAMTPTTFVTSLIAMSSPTNPSLPVAPVLSSGFFLPLLKEAHSLILDLARLSPSNDHRDLVHRSFINTLSHLLIRFVPSHRPRSSSSGASPRVPVFDSWANLGLQDKARTIVPLQGPSHSLPQLSQLAAQSALTSALGGDAAAEWSVNEITIPLIHTILNKSSLPIDFTAPLPANEPYVDDTYAWVRHNYDPRNPIHHLALIVGIIVSHFLPNVFYPHPIPSTPFTHATTTYDVYQAYCTLPWDARPGKKGVSDRPIYIAMVTTFIIAIHEPDSPLGRKLVDTKKLGSKWTTKHTVKGISYINLIRLGIVWGSQDSYKNKGGFGPDGHWGLFDRCHLHSRYTELTRILRSPGPFASFDAVAYLLYVAILSPAPSHAGLPLLSSSLPS